MNEIVIVSAGALSMFILQFVVKPLLRLKLGGQYDFSPKLYVLMVAILNIFTALPLALLKIEGYLIPTDWKQWGIGAMVIILQSLITFGSYELTVKPMKEYGDKLIERNG